MSGQDTQIKKWVDEYLDYLLLERGLADSTLENYTRDLMGLVSFLSGSGITEPRNIGEEDILLYVASMQAQNCSSATIARRCSAIRGFCRYLLRLGKATDFAGGLRTFRPGHPLPGVLSPRDIELLLSAPDTSTILGIRDQAMLEIGYGCALRVSELIAITLYDIDMQEGLLRCFGKGGKERVVPVGDCALDSVHKYLGQARDKLVRGGQADQLFLNHRGNGLSRSGWWRILHGYGQRLGLELHPHTLRHSAATHMLDNGADLRIIQDFLGHSSIAATQIYTNLSRSQLKSAYLMYHPRKDRRETNE